MAPQIDQSLGGGYCVSTWVEVQRVGVLSFDSLPPEFFESQFSSLDSETEANLRPRDSVFRVRFLLLYGLETVKRHNSESETNSEFCVPLKINTESETILWLRDSMFRV